MTTDRSPTDENRDLARRPVGFMIAWGLPIAILLSVNFLEPYLPAAAIIVMIAGAYAWMGVGCVINALRCGRLHCYFSGPIFLIGATLILLVGFDIADFGSVEVMHISYAIIVLVLSTFVLEWIWGAYGKRTPKNESES